MTSDAAVKQFAPFVWKTAKRFSGHGVSFDDLVQEGLIAVAVAAREWREDGGASMLTWIRRPVISAMMKCVRYASAQGMSRRAQGKRKGLVCLGRGAKIRHVSMDEEIDTDLGSDRSTLHDVIGHFEEPPDFLALRQLPGAIARLRREERRVIRLRFVDGLTLQEVGELMGFSRERARQIEAVALGKLRGLVKGDRDVVC